MPKPFEFGELPSGWELRQLSELTAPDRPIVYGIVQAGPHIHDGVPYLRSADVGGDIDIRSLPRTSHEIAAKYRRATTHPGDLVFSLRGDIGQMSIVPAELPSVNLTQGTARIAVNSSIGVDYLRNALSSPIVVSSIAAVAKGSTFREISIDQLRKVVVPVPQEMSEQIAIASVFNAWDRGIRQLSDLIAAKFRFKHGLMQQLLTGKWRFRGFRDDWQTVHLRDVAEECDERNRGRLGTEAVMAVTKAEGIVPMRERTIAADIDRYSVVKKNDFAYNPMRLNIGSIARWSGDGDVVVSPDYVVFRCMEAVGEKPALDTDFLDQYRRSSLWERYVTKSGNGSVRIRIYFDDLGGMKLRLPSLAEQRKIAVFLNIVDREIGLLKKELDALKSQKKGLMQRLLTGRVRVKLPKGAS